ncbi:MAG: hypothetical protein JW754_00125 [Candidatus Aenigmarchaeota archaeon]|nr:hypothetical protein [Candidatus Aenigmarchaeota archaeon]
MPLKVGVTTGLYYVARAEELATIVKKIGYGLTRGANVIEISGDVPHEIDYTDGKEVRYISEKQGIDLLFHGSLTVPITIPERSDWRDAYDHMQKSIRSAVNSGCKYSLFHSCLHFWVEMLTYVGTKLEITMCDHEGRFISEVMHEEPKLGKWFIKHMWDLGEGRYPAQIMNEEERVEAAQTAHSEMRVREREETSRIEQEAGLKAKQAELKFKAGETTEEEMMEEMKKINKDAQAKIKHITEKIGVDESKLARSYMEKIVRKKIESNDKDVRDWNVKTYGRLSDAYKIMSHYLFYTKDPIWKAMVEVYKDKVVGEYKLDYSDFYWLDNAWKRAEDGNDRVFKEFYYAACGAKFLEGHTKKILDWLEGDYIKNELKNKPELVKYAKELKLTFEVPDARDPKYAGLYMIYHPKQLYAAIKTIRKTLKTNRVFITMDFEHMATQGLDPVEELDELTKKIKDFGKYIVSVHSNSPNPLHSHYPIELGDMKLYKCLHYMRRSGMGREHPVYLIFERGGGEDPFKQAVDALRIMANFLEKDIKPEDLPMDFYGLKMTAGDVERQRQIMMDHRFEPLKDLLEVPEEEWGFLSSAATRKGKQKEFRKEELR